MERMVAHLLEVHNGALPVWLCPTQVILPVSAQARCHANRVREALARLALPKSYPRHDLDPGTVSRVTLCGGTRTTTADDCPPG